MVVSLTESKPGWGGMVRYGSGVEGNEGETRRDAEICFIRDIDYLDIYRGTKGCYFQGKEDLIVYCNWSINDPIGRAQQPWMIQTLIVKSRRALCGYFFLDCVATTQRHSCEAPRILEEPRNGKPAL